MNKRCYCTLSLESDEEIDEGVNVCLHCCREILPEIDKIIYTCFGFTEDNCLYNTISNNGSYYVCSDCYHDDNKNEDIEQISDEENQMVFISKKFASGIS